VAPAPAYKIDADLQRDREATAQQRRIIEEETFMYSPVGERRVIEERNNVSLPDSLMMDSEEVRLLKQFQFVISSVAVLSVTFGLVFTALYYLSDGKFARLRGDIQPKYDVPSVGSKSYIDPDKLLRDEFELNGGMYFKKPF
jgi:hypothetical protein